MNIGEAVKGAIGQVAPTVAGAMYGRAAGQVVRQVSKAVLGRPDGTEADLAAAVQNMGPEQLDRLAHLEEQYTAQLQIAAGDRQDARAREVDTGDKTTSRLAYIIIGAAILFNFVPVFIAPAPEVMPMIENGSTLFELLAVGVIGYYFGSSRGSKNKEAIIAGMKP